MTLGRKILVILLSAILIAQFLNFEKRNYTLASSCGNGTCESDENSSNCPSDCQSSCGNGVCESGENCSNCPSDCSASCGNGVCESSCGENSSNCCADCYEAHYEKKCYDNDVYWYDCKGQRTDKAEECGDSEPTNEYQCFGNLVKRKWIERGCSKNQFGAQCVSNESWEKVKDCSAEGKICQNGQCVLSCTNECSYSGRKERRCFENYVQERTCGNYDSDPCLEWSSWSNVEDCSAQGKICQNGQCVSTCSNECSFSGQIERRCSGNYLQKRTCGNYDSDPCLEWSSWINEVDCGTDEWTNEYQCLGNWLQRWKIKKGCSFASCYSYYQWENWENCADSGKICQAGQCIFQQYTLYVSLFASPSSGCSPLNYVDLTATVSGTAQGTITYYFDCENNGNWERIYTTSNTSYTAYDLCSYSSPGTYTARVRVERGGYTAENTAQIYVSSCYAYVLPSVWIDIKANGVDGSITIPYNSSAILSWNSGNANYCYASGAWSGTKSIFGSESTGNLTSGPRTYTITCYGPAGSASDSVTIYLSQVLGAVSPTIQKKVRNLSDGQTQYFDSIYADPLEVLEFQIIVNSGSGAQNVVIKDVLTDKVSIMPNSLKIDGVLTSGDIVSGVSLGNLGANQTKIITFLADIAPANQFSFGQTNLPNTATIYWNGNSFSDSATVIVKKAAVAGAATEAPTGFKTVSDYFLIPLALSSVLIWLFKSHIIKWEEWLDERKKEYQKFRAEKLLELKTAKFRTQKFLREKLF